MGRALRPGEEVTWNISPGEPHGHAIKRQHGNIKDHPAADSPEYIAQNDKSRKRAAHKRSALKKT